MDPRNSKWCHCPPSKVNGTPQSKPRQKVLTKDLGIVCGLNLHLDASATTCLVNRRGLGKAKHVDMQNSWIQEASKPKRFVTKNVGTSVNPADFMTKPMSRPKIEQLMKHHGLRVCGTVF